MVFSINGLITIIYSHITLLSDLLQSSNEKLEIEAKELAKENKCK